MVELQSHRIEWAEDFQREAARIADAAGGRIDASEHIGSTSIPSISAKPIIDLAARTPATSDPFELETVLRPLGYTLHTGGPKNHAVYVRGAGGQRSHILHVFAADQWEHCNQRLFRDKLRRDAHARQRYEGVKRAAASMLDGRAYTAAKSEVIQELLDEERRDRGLPPTSAWDK